MAGTLFVVATPLGNLDDLSYRAVETLRSVDCVVCEDTRRTARLLARHEIRVSLVSCHRHNERQRVDALIERLQRGDSLALVSDAGTPLVSDPGAILVDAALREGIVVRPIPGPTAATTLLSVSGLPSDRFVFEGYLPSRAGERRRRLRELAGEQRTIVIYEAPHRIRATLEDLELVVGDRPVVLGRELTKRHEEILHGTAREIGGGLTDDVRGEITLVLGGAAEQASDSEPAPPILVRVWREALAASDGDRRKALRAAARESGLKKAELVRRLAELGESLDGP